MRLMDVRGNSMGLSQIPTGNLLWVDQVNGNDTLAVRGTRMVPFQSLGAAKTAAVSGDTIMVLPGTYNEKNLLKNQVNWHFMTGAKVVYTGGTDGAIFDTSSTGTNAALTCRITGHGIFQNDSTEPNGFVVNSSITGSNIRIQAHQIRSDKSAIVMTDGGATSVLEIEVEDHIQSNGGIALVVTTSNTTRCRVKARVMYATGDYVIHVNQGDLNLDADLIYGGSTPAVNITGGSGEIVIRAHEIFSNSTSTVYYSAQYNPTLDIINARIICNTSSSPARAIQIGDGGSNVIRLLACTLLVKTAATYSMSASSSRSVIFIGDSVANKASNNIAALVGGLNVDSNVS